MANSFMMNQKPKFKTEFITLPTNSVVLLCDSANLADLFGIVVYTEPFAESEPKREEYPRQRRKKG